MAKNKRKTKNKLVGYIPVRNRMTKNKKNKKNKTKTNKSKSKNNAPQRVYGTASPPSPPPSPPPPPSSPPQRHYGEMRIVYCIIDKCTTFPYGSRETRYYQGWVKYEDDSNEQNVSFMCFDDLQTAATVFNCSGRVNHPRVIRPIFYTFDEKINEALVCFENFDGFLSDAKHEFLASLKSPNLLCAVPGNPNEIVQEEIRELSHALECMHLGNVSSTLLQVRGGYVWSNQKLKIIADCCKEDQINEDWSDMKLRHINSFKIGLNKFFLRTGTRVRWEEKKSFMKCFSVSISSEEKRLSMVYTHPFLEADKKTILKIFPEIDHALKSRHFGQLFLLKLEAAIKNGQFNPHIMIKGDWSRRPSRRPTPWGPKFEKTFCFGRSYNVRSSREFFRFMRNVYQHYYDSSMSLDDFYDEVNRIWPCLTHRIHEYLY